MSGSLLVLVAKNEGKEKLKYFCKPPIAVSPAGSVPADQGAKGKKKILYDPLLHATPGEPNLKATTIVLNFQPTPIPTSRELFPSLYISPATAQPDDDGEAPDQ